MKLLFTGDWQLRAKKPRYRLDSDYAATQLSKVEQILRIAVDEGCSYVVQPGDFYDGIDTPWITVQSYISLFGKYSIPILAVRGQHDLRYHSRNTKNTPLAVMEAAGVVQVLTQNQYWDSLVSFSGYSWGDDSIPVVEDMSDPTAIRILVAHRMIVKQKLFRKQKNYIYASDFLKRYRYDVIVSGDNHTMFIERSGNRYVVNCGSLMRANADQVSHRPVVCIYDTELKRLSRRFLRVRDVDSVLDWGNAELKKERDDKIDVFVSGLGANIDLKLDFLNNLRVAVERETEEPVKRIMEEIFHGREGIRD